jgi:hypothetical protein
VAARRDFGRVADFLTSDRSDLPELLVDQKQEQVHQPRILDGRGLRRMAELVQYAILKGIISA